NRDAPSISAFLPEPQRGLRRPQGAPNQLDVLMAVPPYVSLQDREQRGIRLEGDDLGRRVEPLEIEHAEADVSAGVDDIGPLPIGLERINLLLKNVVI